MTTKIASHTHEEQTSPDKGWTVFLVDDDADDLALGKRVLEKSCDIAEIVCLKSGPALFEALRARQFFRDEDRIPANSLILLDIHMPGEDGIALLTQLRASPYTEKIPVVMLTGDGGTDNVEKTYYMHANGYLTKPLRPEHLGPLHKILKRGYDWEELQT